MEKSLAEQIADLEAELRQVKERLAKCEQRQNDVLFFALDPATGLYKQVANATLNR